MGVVSGMFQPGDTGWGTLSLGHKVIGPIGVIFMTNPMTQYSLQLSYDIDAGLSIQSLSRGVSSELVNVIKIS